MITVDAKRQMADFNVLSKNLLRSFSRGIRYAPFLPHLLFHARTKWHIDTLSFPCHSKRVNKDNITFPHSIRFASDNRNNLASLKTDLPISAAALVNHILREYGIPAYQRKGKKPMLRPYTRRKT